jgi:energy-coupling factor transport system substrate-specific component
MHGIRQKEENKMNPETKNKLSYKLSTASIVLIPIAIGINYLGKYIAGVLRLPLWLDSIGTVLSGMLAGPVIGAASGIINNVIYGVTADPISTVYAVTGLMAGLFAAKGWFKDIKTVLLAGLIIGLVAATVSTPLNIIFWGGQTGNVWGDALYALLISNGQPRWLASFLDSIVVDVPDKLVTVLISYFIFRGLPKKLTNTFLKDGAIEEL